MAGQHDALDKSLRLAGELETALEELYEARKGGPCKWPGKLRILERRIENCTTHPALATDGDGQ